MMAVPEGKLVAKSRSAGRCPRRYALAKASSLRRTSCLNPPYFRSWRCQASTIDRSSRLVANGGGFPSVALHTASSSAFPAVFNFAASDLPVRIIGIPPNAHERSSRAESPVHNLPTSSAHHSEVTRRLGVFAGAQARSGTRRDEHGSRRVSRAG